MNIVARLKELSRQQVRGTKKMRTISVDDKRRAMVVSRHVRWRAIKDHPHHRDVVRYLGPVSEMGSMSVAYQDQKEQTP